MKRGMSRVVGLGLIVTAAIVGSGWTAVRFRELQRVGSSVMRLELSVDKTKPKMLQSLAEQLNRTGFDVAGLNYDQGTLEVVTSKQGLALLKSKGLQPNILNEYVSGEANRASAPDQRFFNPERLEKKLKALNAQFPQVTRLESIGTTHQGRPVWGMLISA
ncbi:MAG: hypothetical protein K2X47_13635, partial [Bdellovibrionales bacterium]|nr:hypothetical protein [Bdellovibrionales bacterium]